MTLSKSISAGEPEAVRPEVSVYWSPGCSMCLRAKEFLEEQGIAFESINVLDRPDAIDELAANGIRGLPVVRRGQRFAYVQSVETIAKLLDVAPYRGPRLAEDQLLERWGRILEAALRVIANFDDATLARRATLSRERPVLHLASHVFQIAEAFLDTVETGVAATKAFQNGPRAGLLTGEDLRTYAGGVTTRFAAWVKTAGTGSIPARLPTYYGEQEAYAVLERGTWHSAQHARQIDAVGAGIGFEPQIPADLYVGLPMPRRLWS
jgi:glutaredoxin